MREEQPLPPDWDQICLPDQRLVGNGNSGVGRGGGGGKGYPIGGACGAVSTQLNMLFSTLWSLNGTAWKCQLCPDLSQEVPRVAGTAQGC